jgi:D-serine deaminase-like pyridoxal phosphate-dependent protein
MCSGAKRDYANEHSCVDLPPRLMCRCRQSMSINNALDDHGAVVFDHALFVLATVMSITTPDRAVVDAEHKALSNDSGFRVVMDHSRQPADGAAGGCRSPQRDAFVRVRQ